MVGAADVASQEVTAFVGHRRLASGPLAEVVVAVGLYLEAQSDAGTNILLFDKVTSQIIDLDWRGSAKEVLARVALKDEGADKPGPGRPKLGVISREVSLLPRHWEWLASQRGGASVTLRLLVDQARKANISRDRKRHVQQALHRFMSAMAGDLPGFEEALRALYADDAVAFKARIAQWPSDVRLPIEQVF